MQRDVSHAQVQVESVLVDAGDEFAEDFLKHLVGDDASEPVRHGEGSSYSQENKPKMN